jgi:hypothetical protein
LAQCSPIDIPPTELAGAGSFSADATHVPRPASLNLRGVSSSVYTFREKAEGAEKLAQALSTTVRDEIERQKNVRPNDPERQAEIEFLEFVSISLDQIAAAIHQARQAATPQEQELKYVEAETLATRLAKVGRDFAERNYERITNYGGYSALVILGTQLFVSLFGVPAEDALTAQLALLGLSSIKK